VLIKLTLFLLGIFKQKFSQKIDSEVLRFISLYTKKEKHVTQSLFVDLGFVSIYLWQNKRIGENGRL
jgi:hypothetical protein